jgi:hypothetical protein
MGEIYMRNSEVSISVVKGSEVKCSWVKFTREKVKCR